ncbi:XrtA/PEP-CTERM system TPR-repeat protein PrsT [Colwellia sp. 20A7]|uniref:XrtA/PEP-CTERM system TPR-repeat protein PrsT n=1 Tax=Colwellia sp. 20A7 TaxID=2689569 RepID=UPI00135C40AE|nr:XrtA/PEP-CTERM system TPR-repeat protein PrsT [Colwellia sp. 20A7]
MTSLKLLILKPVKLIKRNVILLYKRTSLVIVVSALLSPLSHANVDPKVYEDALTSFHDGNYSTSIIHLKNILSVDNTHLPSRVLMAENLLAQGKGSLAEIELNFSKKEGAAIRLLAPLYAKAYLLQNKFDQVLSLPIELQTSDTYQSTMLTFHGFALTGDNQLEEARTKFNKALKLSPYNTEAFIGKTKVALKELNFDEAIELIDHTLTIDPNNIQALLMGAITYKQLKKGKLALEYITQLLTYEPNNYSALLVRATLLMDMQKHDLAISDIDKIVEVLPNEPIANYIKLLSAQASEQSQLTIEIKKRLDTVMTAIPEEVMDEQPIYYFLKGLISFQNNAMEAAQKAFIKYNKINPSDTQALKLIARTELALNNSYVARKYLMKAYLNDDKDSETWALLGQTNLMTGNISEAEFYFDKVMAAFPNELQPRIDLAKLLLLKGDYTKIVTVLSEVLEEDSTIRNETNNDLNFELLLLLARAYQESNQLQAGLNISAVLIKNYPNNSSVNQIHATLLGLSGYLPQAKRFLEEAYALDNDNNQAVIHLARIDALQGDVDIAVERIKAQLVKNNNSDLMVELGDIYYYAKNIKEALVWYQKALSQNQDNVIALEKIVNHFERNKELTKALDIVNNYLNTHNDNSSIHLLASNLYIQNRQHDKAMSEIDLALKHTQNKPPVLFKQAQIYTYLGNKALAKRSLKNAIFLDKSYIAAYQLLIQLYNQDNEKNTALELVNKLDHQLFPAYLIDQFKGSIYMKNDNEKALSFYQKSYQAQANKPALLGLYSLYASQKMYADIDTLLTLWLSNNPNDLEITLALADNYKRSGQLDKSIALYDKHLANNPKNIALLNNAAMANLTFNNIEKAHDLAQRAFKISPDNVNIIDTNALVELALGNNNKALSLLRQANTLDYNNAEIKYHLALTLDKLDRRKEALVYLKESLSSDKPFAEKDKAKALFTAWQQ